MKRFTSFVGLSLALLLMVAPQLAKADCPGCQPPPVGAILDLNGTPLPTTWTQYTVSFVANSASTNITFAFRNDPGFTALDDVSVTTGGGPNLIANGGFETGTITPGVDWTQTNIFGAAFPGVVQNGCFAFGNNSGSFDWCDGSTSAYDAITQAIATTVGDTYTITFFLNQFDSTGGGGGQTNFISSCTNGSSGVDCNANDVLVYAQNGLPARAPEPGTLVLLGSGLIGIAGTIRRKLSL